MHVNYHLFSWPETVCEHINNAGEEDSQGGAVTWMEGCCRFGNRGGEMGEKGRWDEETEVMWFIQRAQSGLCFL